MTTQLLLVLALPAPHGRAPPSSAPGWSRAQPAPPAPDVDIARLRAEPAEPANTPTTRTWLESMHVSNDAKSGDVSSSVGRFCSWLLHSLLQPIEE